MARPRSALHGALLGLFVALLLAAAAPAAPAAPTPDAVDLAKGACAAIGGAGGPAAVPGGRCRAPAALPYRTQWLWLDARVPVGPDARVELRPSRFTRAAVLFRYADGATARQEVRAGDYGRHWRIGGTLLFEAPRRAAPPVAVALGIEQLHWHALLRARLLAAPARESGAVLLVGGAIGLLFLSAVANLALGLAARRAPPVWLAAWAVCVLGWALLWTQVALFAAPWLAGTPAVRLATLFSVFAIPCAAGYFLAGTRGALSRGWRAMIAAVACTVAAAGIAAAASPPSALPAIAALLEAAVAVAAALLVSACAVAVRRGNAAARDFALSFAVPIGAVLWSMFADRGATEGDEGGMYLVLVACALQTLSLTLAGAARLWRVRHERDAALAAGARMAVLAEVDPLTGLLNRRGFLSAVNQVLDRTGHAMLVLFDIDRFKAVNDTHGHEVGDRLLEAVAGSLRAAAGGDVPVGRLGGEEFAALLATADARAAAERLRLAFAAARIALADGAELGATASAGLAQVGAGTDFAAAYRAADRALYAAKAAGRDRLEVAPPTLVAARVA